MAKTTDLTTADPLDGTEQMPTAQDTGSGWASRKITTAAFAAFSAAAITVGSTAGYVLTSNGSGVAPTYQAAADVPLGGLADLAQDQFIGRVTASTGPPETATITAAARTALDDVSVSAMVDTLFGAASTGTTGAMRATAPTASTSLAVAAPGATQLVTALKITDATNVAHGMTSQVADTNAWFEISKSATTRGGAQISGLSDAADATPLNIRGLFGNADPSDSERAIQMQVGKLSGTTGTALGASETVLQLYNWTTLLMTVNGNGNITANAGSFVGNLTGNSDTVTTNANLTGPVTSVGNATTITADAVAYSQMQNVSAASRVMCRGSASGSGNMEECTLGATLTMAGTALDVNTIGSSQITNASVAAIDLGTDSCNTDEIATGAVGALEVLDGALTYADEADGGAMSLSGRAANSAGVRADISATAGQYGAMRERGSALSFRRESYQALTASGTGTVTVTFTVATSPNATIANSVLAADTHVINAVSPVNGEGGRVIVVNSVASAAAVPSWNLNGSATNVLELGGAEAFDANTCGRTVYSWTFDGTTLFVWVEASAAPC